MKWINDRVHGGISLKEPEVAILDTATFQRLRHLRQLSFLHYVFPGGEHSRFQHSLGVLHVMGRMIEKLRYGINEEQERHLRVAAMLHDVGHYPFSHLGEFAYAAVQGPESVVESGREGQSKLVDAMNIIAGAKGLHERLGRILIESRPDVTAAFRSSGLNAKLVSAYLQDDFLRNAHLKQMLHSDLDCDRLDYLVRDATAVGVRYGLVDVDYIINSLQFADVDEATKYLTISPKGVPAVEHFLIARFLHYKGVVCHKTVMGFEAVARAVLLDMIKRERLAPFNSVEDIERIAQSGDDQILRFTDSFFFEQLRQYRDYLQARDEVGTPEFSYAVAILGRIRPRTVFEVQFLEGTESRDYAAAKELLETSFGDLAATIGVDPNLVGYAEKDVTFCDSFMGERPEEELDVFVKSVKVKTYDGTIVPIQKVTESLICSMASHKWKVFRIFYVEPAEGPKPSFQEARDRVTRLVRQRI